MSLQGELNLEEIHILELNIFKGVEEMSDNTKYGLKTQLIFCSECHEEIGYIIYQRWVDFDLALCPRCMEERLKKGTYLEKEIKNDSS